MKKIGIIGTDQRDDINNDLKDIVGAFLEVYDVGDWVVSGGCRKDESLKGGDKWAEWIVRKYSVPNLIFYPNQEEYGIMSTFMRNRQIIDNSNILIVCMPKNEKDDNIEDAVKEFLNKRPERNLFLVL